MKRLLGILVLGLGIIWSSNVQAQDMMQIKGSDTLINLVQRLAERKKIRARILLLQEAVQERG
jgi:ABC-type phosphate transport system substrate-binding protein